MTRLQYLQAVKKLLPTNPVCAEIGVYRGDFSKMILDELEPNGMILVDTWSTTNEKYDDGFNVYYSSDEDYQYVLKSLEQYLFTICKMTSIDACEYFSDHTFDFVYIDADHRYESVKKDLEMWFSLLSDEGFIGGHDYGNEVFSGVKKAIDESMKENKLMLALLSDEGDFLLCKTLP